MTNDKELTPAERQRAALDAHRADTQFGGKKGNTPNNKPEGANTKSWSIRHSIRYIARQEIDMSDPKAFSTLLPKKPTVAQVIAANALAKASKSDMRAVEYVTDQIDGKVHQMNINAELEALLGKTPEELDEIERELDRAIEHARGADHAENGEATGIDESPGEDEVPAGAIGEQPIE